MTITKKLKITHLSGRGHLTWYQVTATIANVQVPLGMVRRSDNWRTWTAILYGEARNINLGETFTNRSEAVDKLWTERARSKYYQ